MWASRSRVARIRLAAAALAGVTALLLTGCINLAPRYRQPALPVPNRWPIPPHAAGTAGGTQALVNQQASPGSAAPTSAAARLGLRHGPAVRDIGWRDFFADPHLQALIAEALKDNRSLRVAVLDVERAQAQFDVQRAARVPALTATGAFTRQRLAASQTFGFSPGVTHYYSASVGVTDFEVDLFGEVRDLSDAALEQYFEQRDARRAAQLTLVAQIASAYLTLAADRQLEQLAEQTFASQQTSYQLTEKEHGLGQVSGLDLAQAQTTVESARADVALYQGNIARDIDALTLLVGGPVDPQLLPTHLAGRVTGLQPLPADLPSRVLLRRPDVLEAEHALRAADANIGAARAAFFPTISLTSAIGSTSQALTGLFQRGTGDWSFLPQASLPIFEGGKLLGNLRVAHANRNIAVAQYEQTIQSAFREVADALALRSTLKRQSQADQALVQATGRAFNLSQQRYRAGIASYLDVLTAERSYYSAKQGLIGTELAEQNNLVTLYKALGGGWRVRTQ